MEATERTRRARARVVAGLVLASLAGGCAGPAGTPEPMWTWRGPELLYLLGAPCDRVYVEVDTVEGVEPSPEGLACLKQLLRRHCDKPAGIRVVRDRPIPLTEARGKPPRLLALLHMSGPPGDAPAGRTAYLHVLFYDSTRQSLPGAQDPYVDRHYPCAIYLDMAYWPRATRHLRRQIITHEVGHVLGLCGNAAHGDGLHCHDGDCVMSRRLRVPLQTWLLGLAPPPGLQTTFCRHCRRDLRAARARRPDPKLSFSGPMLVRREAGYRVGFLPGCARLSFSTDGDLDWRRVRAQLRPLLRRRCGRLGEAGGCLYVRDAPRTLRGKLPAVARAARDPNPAVAEIAAGLLDQLAPSGDVAAAAAAPAGALAAARRTGP